MFLAIYIFFPARIMIGSEQVSQIRLSEICFSSFKNQKYTIFFIRTCRLNYILFSLGEGLFVCTSEIAKAVSRTLRLSCPGTCRSF